MNKYSGISLPEDRRFLTDDEQEKLRFLYPDRSDGSLPKFPEIWLWNDGEHSPDDQSFWDERPWFYGTDPENIYCVPIDFKVPLKTSPWIVIDDYCACRTIEGGNPDDVLARIAFIEKSPRVRIKSPMSPYEHMIDMNKWSYGPKGSGGSGDAEAQGIYGFYPPSREWCDEELVKMGWILG